MDYMEAASDLVVLYRIDQLPKEVIRQVEALERAAELTAEAMPNLRSMRDLSGYWIEINRLENQSDQVYRRLLAKLFSGDYDALTVLKLKEVVDQLENAADAFEHVANTVEANRDQGVLRVQLAGLIVVIAVAHVFACTNGFHDAANAIATSVSTRALSPRAALLVAAVMNLFGALLGTGVAQTVGSGIIEPRAAPRG
jgi:hypothetical protein